MTLRERALRPGIRTRCSSTSGNGRGPLEAHEGSDKQAVTPCVSVCVCVCEKYRVCIKVSLSLSLCLFLSLSLSLYIYIYLFIYLFIYIYIYIYIKYKGVSLSLYIYIYIHTYIHIRDSNGIRRCDPRDTPEPLAALSSRYSRCPRPRGPGRTGRCARRRRAARAGWAGARRPESQGLGDTTQPTASARCIASASVGGLKDPIAMPCGPATGVKGR